MPSGVETKEAAMIKDGHMDVDTWTRLFMVTGAQNDLVWNVHYGCLQHFHSMAPLQRAQGKDSPATRIVFSNNDVKGFIIGQFKQWWNLAVARKADKRAYSWYLGHILHALQDSYPRGHVVRASTTTDCGGILLFQGYDAQHGNGAHKSADFTPSNAKKEADPSLAKRYQCAIDYSTRVLRAFVAYKSDPTKCNFDTQVAPMLRDEVYKFHATSGTRTAGGSRADFAKSDIATTNAFVREEVTLPAGKVVLWNPKSTNVWARKSGVHLCDATGPILSKSPTTTLGIKRYEELPFGQYVNYLAPSSTA